MDDAMEIYEEEVRRDVLRLKGRKAQVCVGLCQRCESRRGNGSEMADKVLQHGVESGCGSR